MKETELAEDLAEHLELSDDSDWDAVHREVEAPSTGRVADLYARKGSMENPSDSLVVEVKTSCNLTVLEQAWFWRNYAHRAAVAVPPASGSKRGQKLRSFAGRVCREMEMGLYIVEGAVRTVVEPRSSRITRRPVLVEEQTEATGGTNLPSDRHTALDRTLSNLEDLTEKRSGISLENAVEQLDHHYKNDRSAYTSLRDAIKKGRSDLSLTWQGGGYHLHI